MTINATVDGVTYSGIDTINTGGKVIGLTEVGGNNIAALLDRSISQFSDVTVTHLGQMAFGYCSNLTDLNLPNLLSVSKQAFVNACSDAVLDFPNLVTVEQSAFTSIYASEIIADNLSVIEAYTFRGAYIKRASFPSVTAIRESAFNTCTQLSEVSFPNAENILNNAFIGCGILKSVYIPNVLSIGQSAFANCSSLATISAEKAKRLDGYTFYNCRALSEAVFPALEYLGASAFYSCSSLGSVSIPVCLRVGGNAFYGCIALNVISLPACSSIEFAAFMRCSSLMSVYLLGSSVASLGASSAFSSTPMVDSSFTGAFGSIYVPASLLTTYQSSTNWAFFSERLVGV